VPGMASWTRWRATRAGGRRPLLFPSYINRKDQKKRRNVGPPTNLSLVLCFDHVDSLCYYSSSPAPAKYCDGRDLRLTNTCAGNMVEQPAPSAEAEPPLLGTGQVYQHIHIYHRNIVMDCSSHSAIVRIMTKHFNSLGEQQRLPLTPRKQGPFFSQACFVGDSCVPLEHLH
jgi:hypothetical protein